MERGRLVARLLPLVATIGLALASMTGCGAAPDGASGRQGPGGTSEVVMNADGSAGATYRPARDAAVIRCVEFWLRDPRGAWARAGAVDAPVHGAFSVGRLDGSQRAGWSDTGAALSVHVVLADGSRLIDPVPWVWSDQFRPAPAASATAPSADAAGPRTGLPPGDSPTPNPEDPFPDATAAGATAVCVDRTWSYAHGGDVCTYHGGVLWWTGRFGPAGPGGTGER
jgi:hypothetical protein